jgi:hypothetical protein
MDTQMTDANQTVDTVASHQIDVVIPKNPPKLLQFFLKFVNAEDIFNDLKNTWPQFQQIGKPSKPKKSKTGTKGEKGEKSKKSKSDDSTNASNGDAQDAPPPPPKRERKIRMSYKRAVDMIRKLSIDDETKAKLEENVKELYKAVKDA